MTTYFVNLLVALFLVVGGARFSTGQNPKCSPARCGDSGPEIRFPFWLKDHQHETCGYSSDFELSCSPSNTTELSLQHPIKASSNNAIVYFPLPVKYSVLRIDYQEQKIGVSYLNADCLPTQLPDNNPNSSQPFPFKFGEGYNYNFTLFNCSSSGPAISRYGKVVPCLKGDGYQAVALASSYSVSEFILPSCAKMYNMHDVPEEIVEPPQSSFTWISDAVPYSGPYLLWSQPSCGGCEKHGMQCMLKTNATDGQTECIGESSKQGASNKHIITALRVAGLVLVVLSILLYYYAYSVKRKEDDHQRKMERVFDDYKPIRPASFTYTDVGNQGAV